MPFVHPVDPRPEAWWRVFSLKGPDVWRPMLPGWAWGALLAVVVGLYANTLRNAFHYDDFSVIVENPAVHDLSHVRGHLMSPSKGNQEGSPTFRPLVMISYVLNYAWGGADPAGYHLVNIGLHALAAGLITLLIWQLTADGLSAWFAGALFALHPIHTEAVNYLTARSSMLYAVASVAALWLIIRYRESKRRSLLGAALAAYLAALLSKEAAIVVPVLLLVYDCLAPRPAKPDRVIRAISYGGVGAVTLGYLALRRLVMNDAETPALDGNIVTAVLTFGALVVRTLSGHLAPIGLSAAHDFQPLVALTPAAGALCALAAAIVLLAVLVRRQAPLVSLGILWFVIALLPVAVLPLMTTLALYQEHRGYLSGVGFVMVGGPLLALWWREGRGGGGWIRRGGLILLGVIVAGTVVQRNTVWRDDVTLWSDVLRKTPHQQMAYINLGAAYQARGDLASAANTYRQALDRFPDNGILHNNIGVIYRAQGDLNRAIQEFQAAIRSTPGFALPYFNLGLILEQGGYSREALIAYDQFLRLAPGQYGTAAKVPIAVRRAAALRRDGGSTSPLPAERLN